MRCQLSRHGRAGAVHSMQTNTDYDHSGLLQSIDWHALNLLQSRGGSFIHTQGGNVDAAPLRLCEAVVLDHYRCVLRNDAYVAKLMRNGTALAPQHRNCHNPDMLQYSVELAAMLYTRAYTCVTVHYLIQSRLTNKPPLMLTS